MKSKGLSKNKQRSFFRDVLSILTGRIAVQLAGILTGILIARVLGVEGKGTIAAIILVPQLIITIAGFGVSNAAAYHIGRETWPIERIVQTTLFTALVTGCIGLLLCLGWILLIWENSYSPMMSVLAVLMVPGAILYTYIAGIFLGLQRISDYSISSWGPGILKLLGTVLLVGFAGFGISGAVGAATFSVFAVAAVMLWRLSKLMRIKLRFYGEIAKQITSIGSSYAIVYFMMVMVYKSNIFLVQIFAGIESLGVYSLGSNLAESLWQIPAVLSTIVFTRSAAATDELAFSKKVASLARLTFLIGVCGGIVAAIVAPTVVPLLYGDEFLPSVDILVALLPGVVAMVIFKILRQDLSGRGKPWAAACIIVPMLVVLVVSGVVFIPIYGAYGAAISMSTVYVIGTIGFIFLYAGRCGISIFELVIYRKSDFAVFRRVFNKS